jgi:uncharacterized protein
MTSRPPLPPFTIRAAIQKVRMAEDAWNTRDPRRVAQAYTFDSEWRNRVEFPNGRDQIVEFLQRKWARELVQETSNCRSESRYEAGITGQCS